MLGPFEQVVGRGVVEHAHRDLVAAVVDVVEQGAVALGGIGGPEDVEIGGVLHHAARVLRRQREIDDAAIERVARIELAVKAALNPLVRTGGAECHPAEKRFAFGDFDSGHRRQCRHGGEQRNDSGDDNAVLQHGSLLCFSCVPGELQRR